ncbi:DUF4352 domain-containing protein [Streptomyces sp. NPDC048696]|uniref:DUF4352 domain-containing protein n=1 Tax=Streptomyces sp. NPDC048696 TaxID=3365585 RepID=UPI00372404F7
MRTRTTTAVVGTTVLTLALTACDSGTKDVRPVKATTEPASSAPTPSGPVALGASQKARLADKAATLNAIAVSYRQPDKTMDPPGASLGMAEGSIWARLDAKVCSTSPNGTGQPISVSAADWHLSFSDGTQAEPTGLTGGDIPKPEFPYDGTISPGQCVRGLIMLPVPPKQRPARIVYKPRSLNSRPLEWTVPKT